MRYNSDMGIRWYAWAITSDELEEARIEPWKVIRRADERHDLDGWTNSDLDKTWWQFQQLFGGPPKCGDHEPRVAYRLVAGNVTYPWGYERGYVEHIGLLGVDEVCDIARDLDTVTVGDVRAYCAGSIRPDDTDCLMYFLREMQSFTADAASRGHAIIYMIR